MVAEGHSVQQCLKGTGILTSQLDDPHQTITLRQEIRFHRNLIELSGDPTLGLRIGSAYLPQRYGLLGYAVLSAATLRDALVIATNFGDLSFTWFGLRLAVAGQDHDVLVPRSLRHRRGRAGIPVRPRLRGCAGRPVRDRGTATRTGQGDAAARRSWPAGRLPQVLSLRRRIQQHAGAHRARDEAARNAATAPGCRRIGPVAATVPAAAGEAEPAERTGGRRPSRAARPAGTLSRHRTGRREARRIGAYAASPPGRREHQLPARAGRGALRPGDRVPGRDALARPGSRVVARLQRPRQFHARIQALGRDSRPATFDSRGDPPAARDAARPRPERWPALPRSPAAHRRRSSASSAPGRPATRCPRAAWCDPAPAGAAPGGRP